MVLVTSGFNGFLKFKRTVKSHIHLLLEQMWNKMYKERAGHVEFGTAVYRACAPLVDWRYLDVCMCSCTSHEPI